MPVEDVFHMASGGRRNRNQLPSEGSARSEIRGYSLTALPTQYDGPIPEFPLADASGRELELWEEKWRGPHGAAWSMPSEIWRAWDVAMWVRTAVRCEDADAPPTLISNLHRLGDRVGLSTAGLAEMGWKVAPDEVAEKRAQKDPAPEPESGSRGRVTVAKAHG